MGEFAKAGGREALLAASLVREPGGDFNFKPNLCAGGDLRSPFRARRQHRAPERRDNAHRLSRFPREAGTIAVGEICAVQFPF